MPVEVRDKSPHQTEKKKEGRWWHAARPSDASDGRNPISQCVILDPRNLPSSSLLLPLSWLPCLVKTDLYGMLAMPLTPREGGGERKSTPSQETHVSFQTGAEEEEEEDIRRNKSRLLLTSPLAEFRA